MAEKSLTIDSNLSKKGIDVSKYYKHIAKTFLISLGILFFGLLFFFLIIRIMPGNPYSLAEGDPIYDIEVTQLALDKNPIIQFFVFLNNLLLGNWGNYFYHYSTINGAYYVSYFDEWLFNYILILPYHKFLGLIFTSFSISLIFGIYFGHLFSKFKNKKKGKIIRLLIISLSATPLVGFGYTFKYIGFFSGLLPGCSGASSYCVYLSDGDYITNFPLIDCLLSGKCFWERLLYLITPVSILNLIMIPFITFFTYKLIEHFKSSRKIPKLTRELGFFYSIVVSSVFFIAYVVCTHDMTFQFNAGIYMESFNGLILSTYLILITFFVFNLLFNILICGITLFVERKDMNLEKKARIEDKSSIKDKNSVINEDAELQSLPKEKKNQNKQDIGILIVAVMISLLFLIIFLLLEKYFIIFLGILGIIICAPLIIKKWRLKLTSKDEIESNESNVTHKTSNEENSAVIDNKFSKRLIISGSIIIVISILGITLYGWEESGKNIFRTQTTLIIGITTSLISIGGVILGFLSAYYGKWVKKVINYLILIFISIPCLMILSIIINIIGIANSSVIWIIGLISIPIVAHFTDEIISSEMRKNSIIPALYGPKIQKNTFKNIKPNLILPIIGLLCFSVCFSIFLYEGYNTVFEFLDPSFNSLGRDIHMCRNTIFSIEYRTSLFTLLIPSFLLFLIMSGFMLLGLGLYDYKLNKKEISKIE